MPFVPECIAPVAEKRRALQRACACHSARQHPVSMSQASAHRCRAAIDVRGGVHACASRPHTFPSLTPGLWSARDCRPVLSYICAGSYRAFQQIRNP
jgi:hypothetical protein